jgi:hypothetical protein
MRGARCGVSERHERSRENNDADLDTISAATGQNTQWVATRGSL